MLYGVGAEYRAVSGFDSVPIRNRGDCVQSTLRGVHRRERVKRAHLRVHGHDERALSLALLSVTAELLALRKDSTDGVADKVGRGVWC